MYYRNAAAAIIVYDITSEVSFEVLQEWITELNRLGPPNIVLAIAGNKCDLEEKREVKRRGWWCYSDLLKVKRGVVMVTRLSHNINYKSNPS